jgi:hypothetical protein
MDSRGMLIYEVGMDLLAELGEEVGSHVDRAGGSLVGNSIAVHRCERAKPANRRGAAAGHHRLAV